MNLIDFSADEYKIFILILIRISVILFMFPFFGSPVVPAVVKTGLALVITIILYPAISINPDLFPVQKIDFTILVFAEFVVGMALSYSIQIFFGAVQFAGDIIGFQMGFSMINVIDPQSGANISMMSQIGYLVVLLIFILSNGHHIILSAIVESFRIVKMGDIYLQPGLLEQLKIMVAGLFVLGIKIAAPAMAALLFTSAAFGICAKFVPQMPVLIIAFPLKIAVGLIMFGSTLQIIGIMLKNYLGTFKAVLSSILVLMGG